MTDTITVDLFDKFLESVPTLRYNKLTSEFARYCKANKVAYSDTAKSLVRDHNTALKKGKPTDDADAPKDLPAAKGAQPAIITKPAEVAKTLPRFDAPPGSLSGTGEEYQAKGTMPIGDSLHDLVVKADTVSTGKMIKVKSLRGVVDIRETIIPADEVVEVKYTAEVVRAVEVGILEIV